MSIEVMPASTAAVVIAPTDTMLQQGMPLSDWQPPPTLARSTSKANGHLDPTPGRIKASLLKFGRFLQVRFLRRHPSKNSHSHGHPGSAVNGWEAQCQATMLRRPPSAKRPPRNSSQRQGQDPHPLQPLDAPNYFSKPISSAQARYHQNVAQRPFYSFEFERLVTASSTGSSAAASTLRRYAVMRRRSASSRRAGTVASGGGDMAETARETARSTKRRKRPKPELHPLAEDLMKAAEEIGKGMEKEEAARLYEMVEETFRKGGGDGRMGELEAAVIASMAKLSLAQDMEKPPTVNEEKPLPPSEKQSQLHFETTNAKGAATGRPLPPARLSLHKPLHMTDSDPTKAEAPPTKARSPFSATANVIGLTSPNFTPASGPGLSPFATLNMSEASTVSWSSADLEDAVSLMRRYRRSLAIRAVVPLSPVEVQEENYQKQAQAAAAAENSTDRVSADLKHQEAVEPSAANALEPANTPRPPRRSDSRSALLLEDGSVPTVEPTLPRCAGEPKEKFCDDGADEEEDTWEDALEDADDPFAPPVSIPPRRVSTYDRFPRREDTGRSAGAVGAEDGSATLLLHAVPNLPTVMPTMLRSLGKGGGGAARRQKSYRMPKSSRDGALRFPSISSVRMMETKEEEDGWMEDTEEDAWRGVLEKKEAAEEDGGVEENVKKAPADGGSSASMKQPSQPTQGYVDVRDEKEASGGALFESLTRRPAMGRSRRHGSGSSRNPRRGTANGDQEEELPPPSYIESQRDTIPASEPSSPSSSISTTGTSPTTAAPPALATGVPIRIPPPRRSASGSSRSDGGVTAAAYGVRGRWLAPSLSVPVPTPVAAGPIPQNGYLPHPAQHPAAAGPHGPHVLPYAHPGQYAYPHLHHANSCPVVTVCNCTPVPSLPRSIVSMSTVRAASEVPSSASGSVVSAVTSDAGHWVLQGGLSEVLYQHQPEGLVLSPDVVSPPPLPHPQVFFQRPTSPTVGSHSHTLQHVVVPQQQYQQIPIHLQVHGYAHQAPFHPPPHQHQSQGPRITSTSYLAPTLSPPPRRTPSPGPSLLPATSQLSSGSISGTSSGSSFRARSPTPSGGSGGGAGAPRGPQKKTSLTAVAAAAAASLNLGSRRHPAPVVAPPLPSDHQKLFRWRKGSGSGDALADPPATADAWRARSSSLGVADANDWAGLTRSPSPPVEHRVPSPVPGEVPVAPVRQLRFAAQTLEEVAVVRMSRSPEEGVRGAVRYAGPGQSGSLVGAAPAVSGM
ncbi:hypothetical protein HDU96_005810 [Phlyctochytrium bullatum]|nr:hypothetical protein HDU96_005810 [Phlyctochytrium bullatum]